jgi:hypothetical protein
MMPRLWRMVDTIARRMGIPSRKPQRLRTIVLAGNGLMTSSTRLSSVEEGRHVAAAVRMPIVSKRQPASQAKAGRKQWSRKSRLPGGDEKLVRKCSQGT